MNNDDILFEEVPSNVGLIGYVTLNRPKALNALSLAMCQRLGEKLTLWQDNPELQFVVIKGVGDRAFCAGGDIKKIYEQRHTGLDHLTDFFWHEYRLNYIVHAFPKPYIALMHGITMGGGAGISVHGSHRIATPNLKFAMPETKIGFFPDIGSNDFFHRCPGYVGLYLALTGSTIDAQAAMELGIITHLVSNDAFASIEQSLLEISSVDEIDDVLQKAEIHSPPSELQAYYEAINACFSADTVEDIIHRLEQCGVWEKAVAKRLRQRSPMSLKVTFESYYRSQGQLFNAIIQSDFDIAQHFLNQQDFFEGIRAALIDKDQSPRWQPATLPAVKPDEVNVFFSQMGRWLNER